MIIYAIIKYFFKLFNIEIKSIYLVLLIYSIKYYLFIIIIIYNQILYNIYLYALYYYLY